MADPGFLMRLLLNRGRSGSAVKLAEAFPEMSARVFDAIPQEATNISLTLGYPRTASQAKLRGLVTDQIYYANLLAALRTCVLDDWLLANAPRVLPITVIDRAGGKSTRIVSVQRRVLPLYDLKGDAETLAILTRGLSPEKRRVLFSVWNPLGSYTGWDIVNYIAGRLWYGGQRVSETVKSGDFSLHTTSEPGIQNSWNSLKAEVDQLAQTTQLDPKTVNLRDTTLYHLGRGEWGLVKWAVEYFCVGSLMDIVNKPGKLLDTARALLDGAFQVAGRCLNDILAEREFLEALDHTQYPYAYISRYIAPPATSEDTRTEENGWSAELRRNHTEMADGALAFLVWLLRTQSPPKEKLLAAMRQAYETYPLLEKYVRRLHIPSVEAAEGRK